MFLNCALPPIQIIETNARQLRMPYLLLRYLHENRTIFRGYAHIVDAVAIGKHSLDRRYGAWESHRRIPIRDLRYIIEGEMHIISLGLIWSDSRTESILSQDCPFQGSGSIRTPKAIPCLFIMFYCRSIVLVSFSLFPGELRQSMC
jgi:hypothetical protein